MISTIRFELELGHLVHSLRMKMWLFGRVAIICLMSCALPHVDPQPRSPMDANAAAVRVDVTCAEADPFSMDGDIPTTPDVVRWSSPASGTGVIISEREVLTAAHVVTCPVIPVVHVTMRDGRTFRMRVNRDGTDVAELAMASLDRFHLAVAPPITAVPEGEVFAAVIRPWPSPHGEADGLLVRGMVTVPGDSGAGVYDTQGRLVGIVEAGGGFITKIARVP